MKQIQGTSFNINDDIIGRITFGKSLFSRSNEILVSCNVNKPALGYSATITSNKSIIDNGKPYCIVYDIDRYIGHKRNFYDTDWKNLHITSDCPEFDDTDLNKPEGLDEMLQVAKTLSSGFPFVRVDLYYIKGRVYFGEMTFYPWSGYVRFTPDTFDYELGKQFCVKL
jgi:hypothetical protein